ADRPQAPHDIDCGVRGGAVCLIIDDDVAGQKLLDPAGPAKRLDRADAHVGRDHVLRRLVDADKHVRVCLLELVDGLLDELVTIDNNSYALTSGDSPAGNLGEDHRLAGAGWKRDRRVFGRIVFPVLLDRLDTLELVRPQLHLLLLARNRATTLIEAYSHAFALFMVDPFGRSGLVKATLLVERRPVKQRQVPA